MFHAAIRALIKFQSKYCLHILNVQPKAKTNVIYAVNHSCKDDFPLTCAAVGRHMYVLVGRQHLRLIDRIGFCLNGVIYVDRKDKANRKTAISKMKSLLGKGYNLCIYPEGTWNLAASKPMLPLYWGIITIAGEAKVPIVPVIMEYRGEDCYVKFGLPMYIRENDDKKDKINELTDSMATMKWEIWEMFPVVSRGSIDKDEWTREVKRRLEEYPWLDYEYEKSCVLKI